ncbi:class I SAM-dependent methyltransferase [Marinifilum sp. JC120]|nr:class I SAM-dependent methyltransferase [Marinifilum sp. JC120]
MHNAPSNITPDFIYEAQSGFYQYCTLKAAFNINIFEYLQSPNSCKQVAEHVRKDPVMILKLLEALMVLRLVQKENDSYQNTPVAEAFCVSGNKLFQGHLFQHTHETFGSPFYEQCDPLSPPEEQKGYSEKDAILGAEAGVGFALPHTLKHTADLIENLDVFKNASSFLDLGAGPGVFAMTIADRKDDLDVTLFDLPEVAAHAKKIAERYRKQDRLNFLSGDMFQKDLGGPYDIIFSSDCIYMARHDLVNFLKGLKDNLTTGGAVILRHNETNHNENAPKTNALLNLGAALMGFGDYMFTEGTIPEALKQAGFKGIKSVPQHHMTHHYMIHTAYKD